MPPAPTPLNKASQAEDALPEIPVPVMPVVAPYVTAPVNNWLVPAV